MLILPKILYFLNPKTSKDRNQNMENMKQLFSMSMKLAVFHKQLRRYSTCAALHMALIARHMTHIALLCLELDSVTCFECSFLSSQE